MALSTTIQLAMAFSEQVYRRANTEQQLGSQKKEQGYEELGVEPVMVNEQAKWEITGTGRTYNEGFYYNNETGFVGQIINANGQTFVVFRGSDLSGTFPETIPSVLFKEKGTLPFQRKGDASLLCLINCSNTELADTPPPRFAVLPRASRKGEKVPR
jgi:hypothetical protein